MIEKQIENKLKTAVKKNGGIALKLVCPSFAGMPDRLILRTWLTTSKKVELLTASMQILKGSLSEKHSSTQASILPVCVFG